MLKILEFKRSKCGISNTTKFHWFDRRMANDNFFEAGKRILRNESKTYRFINLNLYKLMKKRYKRFSQNYDVITSSESFRDSNPFDGRSISETSTVEFRILLRAHIKDKKMEFLGAFLKKSLNLKEWMLSSRSIRSPIAIFSSILCLQFVQLIVDGEYKEAIQFAKSKLYPILSWVSTSSMRTSISDLDVAQMFEGMEIIGSKKNRSANFSRIFADVIKTQRYQEEMHHADSRSDANTRNVGLKFRASDIFRYDFNSYGNLFTLPSADFERRCTRIMLPGFIELCLTLLGKCNNLTKRKCLEQNLHSVMKQLSDHVNNFLQNLPGDDNLIFFHRDIVTIINDSQEFSHNCLGACDSELELCRSIDVISLCTSRFFWLKYFDSACI